MAQSAVVVKWLIGDGFFSVYFLQKYMLFIHFQIFIICGLCPSVCVAGDKVINRAVPDLVCQSLLLVKDGLK